MLTIRIRPWSVSSPQQLELLALKEDALKYTRPLAENCLDISRLPGIALNNSAGVLDITVPQCG
jgi:hypothetical protein